MDLNKLWDSLDPKPWQIKEEFLPFLQFVIDNRVRTILEIGTHKGGTASALLRMRSQVTSVDIVKQPEIDKLEKEMGFEFYMREDFILDTPGCYDLLFIDAGHTYEECLTDYNEYRDLVKPGGFIFFHDTKNSALHEKQNCEVWKVIEDIELEEVFRAENGEEWGGLQGFKV
jgi:predicted O-methyltransferase YrrM